MSDNIKNIIRASYNKNAALRSDEIPEWKDREVHRILSRIDSNGVSLLDLGAGSGIFAEYFANKGMDVLCIDLSKSMIELCRARNLKAEVMDFYDLKIEDNSFDLIWSFNTLLHVPKKDIHIVLKEVKRVLKKNGIFYLGMYGGKCHEGIWENDTYEPKRFFSFYKKDELLAIIQDYFRVIEFEEIILDGDLNFFAFILK